jgi:hypothetical protein
MSFMIKKLILNAGLVLVVVLVLDFAIGRTLRHFYFKETSGLHYRTTYSIEETDAEVLVFGASRANHHYVPEVFQDSLKKTFYNTGRDANGIFYQMALLKSVLKRYKPEVIILDYAGSFDNDRTVYDNISSLLPYYRKHKEIRSEVELRGPYEKIKLLSEIYPFNSQLLTIAIGNMEANKKRNPDNKGYMPLETTWHPEMRIFNTTKMYAVDSNKVNSLKKFIARAKESGTKVYIVYSPLYQKMALYPEVEICSKICSALKVPFLDFSRDTFFLNRGDLFYDVMHLNHDGAQIFSGIIADTIKKDMQSVKN